MTDKFPVVMIFIAPGLRAIHQADLATPQDIVYTTKKLLQSIEQSLQSPIVTMRQIQQMILQQAIQENAHLYACEKITLPVQKTGGHQCFDSVDIYLPGNLFCDEDYESAFTQIHGQIAQKLSLSLERVPYKFSKLELQVAQARTTLPNDMLRRHKNDLVIFADPSRSTEPTSYDQHETLLSYTLPDVVSLRVHMIAQEYRELPSEPKKV